MNYNKPPLAVPDQVALLKKRGMVFANEDSSVQILTHINYYRLRAYWLPFESGPGGLELHTFHPGTRFEDVLAHYAFDQRLKLLLLDAIERVEISLRTRWAHELSLRYGSHAYLDVTLFADAVRHTKCMQSLRDEARRSHETFIKHYHQTYTHPALPPIWAVCEVLTLGQLSQWLDNLKRRSDRQAIAQALGFDEVVVCAFAHHLATVRNLCAHHSRVWNRKFTIRMKLPRRPNHVTPWFNAREDHKVYNTLLMLALLLEHICPDSTWKSRLMRLIDQMPNDTTEAMGFPSDWRLYPVWASAYKDIDDDPSHD